MVYHTCLLWIMTNKTSFVIKSMKKQFYLQYPLNKGMLLRTGKIGCFMSLNKICRGLYWTIGLLSVNKKRLEIYYKHINIHIN